MEDNSTCFSFLAVDEFIRLGKGNMKLAYDLYRAKGSAPAAFNIVCLHGLMGTRRNWVSIASSLAGPLNSSEAGQLDDTLSTSSNVIAFDLRNHGDSPHSAVHSLEAMGSDVELSVLEVLEKEKLAGPPLLMMGHSMGGMALLDYFYRTQRKKPPSSFSGLQGSSAPHHPSLLNISGGIIVDIAPTTRPASFYRVFEIIKMMGEMPLSGPGAVTTPMQAEKWLLDRSVENGGEEVDLWLARYMLTNLDSSTPKPHQKHFASAAQQHAEAKVETTPLRWKANVPVLANCAASILWRGAPPIEDDPRIPVPSLFVFGGRSPYFTPEAVKSIDAFFQDKPPVAELRVIEGGGHFVHIERRKQFVNVVQDWLRSRLTLQQS